MFKNALVSKISATKICSLLLLSFILMGLVLLPVSQAFASDVRLAWDANSETDIAGYKLYYKSGSAGPPYEGSDVTGKPSPIEIPLSSLTDQTNPDFLLSGIAQETDYYFVVTAYTVSGIESGYSNEVHHKTGSASHTITVRIGANGNIAPSGPVTVATGATQDFNIAADTGYHVTDVFVDGQSIGPVTSYTFSNVTADHSISAVFAIDTYTIDATTSGNGTISPAGQVTVSYGQQQTFTITPEADHQIADVIVDGSSVGAVTEYTFNNVAGPHSIEAHFKLNAYTISAQATANGTISPAGDSVVDHGASLTYTVDPNQYYHVSDVLVDGISVGPKSSYTFTNVSANHTISAAFAADTYTITLSAGENGSVEAGSTEVVQHGSDLTVNFIPDANYVVADVLVDDVSVGAVSSYTLSDVQSDHHIAVTFKPDTNVQITIESGELTVDHQWQRVVLKKSFNAPVVVAGPLALADDAPAVLRIRNVDTTGFDIRVQEWDYLDGVHEPETVGYLVMERGSFTLDNGYRVEAGIVETAKTSTYENIAFASLFQESPVVMTSIITFNEADAVTGRLNNVQTAGFDYRLQEQDSNTQNHAAESVAYIAWEPSMGIVDGLNYEVKKTDAVVSHKFYAITFDQAFNPDPVLIADMQSALGANVSNLRVRNKTNTAFEVQVDEEQSKDREVNHRGEAVGFIALSRDKQSVDTDGDGLKDIDELNLYHTDPQNTDTDADGIDDGDELAYWGDAWNADLDADGLINLLDADADGDEILDGEELANGTDPGVAEPPITSVEFLVGEVEVDHHWKRVDLNQTFTDPVVVAGPLSLNGAQASVLRIRNVDATGFEIRVQEWEYLDGYHIMETVSYMVMERGLHTLENGAKVEAGTFTAPADGGFGKIQFGHDFQSVPVVTMTVTSFNEAEAVTHRMHKITRSGAECQLQEEQASSQQHAAEVISYIAWEASSGTLNSYAYEVGRTAKQVQGDLFNIMYAEPSGKTPFFVADMQTRSGGDTANLRIDNKDAYSLDIFVQEETSFDTEVYHNAEVVGYVVVYPLN